MNYQELWKPIKIERDDTLSIQLGPLNLAIHRGDMEWHIASTYSQNEQELFSVRKIDEMPDHDWTRWVINEPIDEVVLHPKMPDRPLIVRPEMPVCLLPNQSVQFYIGVPIWLSISLGSHFRDIAEIPAIKLSNSWFGSPTEGELCYAMRTTAKLQLSDLQGHPHRAVVPFEIRNTSNEKLNFERLCLHTNQLRVYQGEERMWTNQGRVTYRGEEKWSRIVYARGIPPYDGAEKLIGKARGGADRGTLLKTFDNWKHLVDI